VVSRAAYEGGITLVYLMTVGDKSENARLYEARTVIEVLQTEDQCCRFKRGPATKAKRRGWADKTIAEMAAAITVEGHKAAYVIQSWVAHSSVGGWRADAITETDGVVRWQWGQTCEPEKYRRGRQPHSPSAPKPPAKCYGGDWPAREAPTWSSLGARRLR
jgi:hypothetical protein